LSSRVLLALLDEGGLLLWGMGLGDTNFIVISVEDCVELSHEDVTDEEHFFLDVHFHDCGGTDGLA